MSFVDKKGKVSSVRRMIIRQQLSDVFANGKIITTITKAKESKRHIDNVMELAKKGDLASIRKISSLLLDTKLFSKDKLLKMILEIGKKYHARKGGYTRILKLGTRPGDNTEEVLLELV